jgi:H/ACA ribonucleoprotein complex subunit 4
LLSSVSMGDLPFEKIEREILIRQPDLTTGEKFGCDPFKRSVEDLIHYGVVNIDKPSGPTSHQVSAFVQKILKINKSGHSGTLDPKVTGCLPIALDRGTRIVQGLLTAGKEYVCVMHLHSLIDEAKVREVMLTKFVGKIRQLPPVKSAVKRQFRNRRIYYIDIIEIVGQDVLFTVGCQAGTYIRKLCHDIGEALDTGAHMAELRRTKAGPFNEGTSLCSLQDLTDAFHYYKEEGDETRIRNLIKPIEVAIDHLPKVWVADTAVDALAQGATLKVPGIMKVESEIQVDEPIAILTLKNELVAVGKSLLTSKQMQTDERGIAVRSSQVFMRTSVYPRVEKKVV